MEGKPTETGRAALSPPPDDAAAARHSPLPDSAYYRLSVWRRAQLLLAAGSAAALLAAYISQYLFGLAPCALCLQQRYPYLLLLALSAIGFLPKLSALAQRAVLVLSILLLLVEAGLAFRHAGVERHWWPGPGCSDASTAGASLEELRAAIASAPLVRCDIPAFEFAGLSMAGWNALFAFSLALTGIAVLWRIRRDGRERYEVPLG